MANSNGEDIMSLSDPIGLQIVQKSEFSRRPAASAGYESVPPFVPKYQLKVKRALNPLVDVITRGRERESFGIVFALFVVVEIPRSDVGTAWPELLVTDELQGAVVNSQASATKFDDLAVLWHFFEHLGVKNSWWAEIELFASFSHKFSHLAFLCA